MQCFWDQSRLIVVFKAKSEVLLMKLVLALQQVHANLLMSHHNNLAAGSWLVAAIKLGSCTVYTTVR